MTLESTFVMSAIQLVLTQELSDLKFKVIKVFVNVIILQFESLSTARSTARSKGESLSEEG